MVCALGTHVSYIAAAAHSEASPQLDHYLITSACKLTFRAATECTSWGGAVAGNADLRAVNELSTTAPSNPRGGIRSLPTAGLLRSHQARRRRERARRRHAREFITVSGSAGSPKRGFWLVVDTRGAHFISRPQCISPGMRSEHRTSTWRTAASRRADERDQDHGRDRHNRHISHVAGARLSSGLARDH